MTTLLPLELGLYFPLPASGPTPSPDCYGCYGCHSVAPRGHTQKRNHFKNAEYLVLRFTDHSLLFTHLAHFAFTSVRAHESVSSVLVCFTTNLCQHTTWAKSKGLSTILLTHRKTSNFLATTLKTREGAGNLLSGGEIFLPRGLKRGRELKS